MIQRIYDQQNFVVLDSETTDRYPERSQAVSLAVIDHLGNILIDTHTRPTIPIESGAQRIHGISMEMLVAENAPDWPQVWQQLKWATQGKHILIYNAWFDMGIIETCCKAHKLESEYEQWSASGIVGVKCVMRAYAEVWKDWDSYHGSYRWQQLKNAAQQQKLPVQGVTFHGALADCQVTLMLLNKVWGQKDVAQPR